LAQLFVILNKDFANKCDFFKKIKKGKKKLKKKRFFLLKKQFVDF
jgi:hypothetical protein